MQMFAGNNSVTSDGLLVLDSLVVLLNASIKPEMDKIVSILKYCLNKYEETDLNRISFTLLCTLIRTMRDDFNQYLPEMLNLSINALKAENVDKNNKLNVISAIGEFALYMPLPFSQFTDSIMQILYSAMQMSLGKAESDEMSEFFKDLRNSLMETNLSILHGHHNINATNKFQPHICRILE